MTKFLVCILFLFSLGSVCYGQSWSTLNVDLVIPMNTSSPGTALTTSILNAGTVSNNCTLGSSCTWGTPASGGSYSPTFLVGENQGSLSNLGSVCVMSGSATCSSPTYAASSLNFNSIGHQDGDPGAGSNIQLVFDGGTAASATTVSGLVGITLNMPSPQTNTNDFDIFGFWQLPNGNYAMMQLNAQTGSTACDSTWNGAGPIPSGTIGIRVEGKPTIHSPCIPLTPGQSYFASMWWDLNTGVVDLYVYTPAGTLVGNTTVTMGDTGGTFSNITVGNNEIGYNDGTITYFQNLMLNWTSAPDPLFWTSGSLQPPTNLSAKVN
jgi:hypothetical protein